MTGKELLSYLNELTEDQLSQKVKVHDHYYGEWLDEIIVVMSEDDSVLEINIRFHG